ncbi:MAG: DNA/RNA non-specific endonuclease, partial [Acidobacteriota bacterium]|nr:DNA/RNA non-specific endonuclease [Acidobacteriota bacterium]
MKNKAINGGVIALAILALIAFFCFKLGEKFFDNTPQPEQTNTNTSVEPPRNLPPGSPEQAAQVYLALGNPSNATNNTANRDNYLMVNKAYALSYNSSRGTANWVSWRIAESDFGATDRQNNFRPDPNLPPGFVRVTPADYAGSGFDRGHLSPSADRSNSEEANSLTFLMTNMIPQTGDLNRNPWEELETYSRNLVKRGNVDLYVVAGVYGEKGKLKKKVAIPTNNWKIIVAVPEGAGISAINENTHVIAVDMPNTTGIASDDWRKFRTTVRSIEQKTGYNFLSNLPQDL